MVEAADLQHLGDSLWIWQAFDPAAKSDLFSTAVKVQDRLFLIDPISLAVPAIAELTSSGSVFGVLVTNANHPRSAVTLARHLDAPIFAAEPVIGELGAAKTRAITAGEVAPGVAAIAIAGAAPGEMAFHFADDGGTMVIGDALINFEPYGFALLPPKYCLNQKEMRRSLRQLLDWRFDRLLFAHGLPVVSSARARLEARLANNR